MKVKAGAGSGPGIGAEGRREREDVLRQNRRRSDSHAGHKNLWGREQCVELSRLVLGFARQHSRLPDVGDRGFWQLCHDIFRGAYTHRQVQAKVRYMHLRFRRFASGTGARFRAADGHILKIWTHIVQRTSPSSSGPASYSPPAEDSVSEMDHGHARVHPGVGPELKKGANQVSGTPPAARQEPHQEVSACSTEIVHEYYEEEVHSRGEFQNNAENNDAASGAADDDFAKNNALLHHLTVADLAAAVKTLAEIVARGPPLKV